MPSIIILLLASFCIDFLILINPLILREIVDIQFFLYVFIILFDFYKNKNINLFQTWICGFIFIILSEIIIISFQKNLDISYINAIYFYLTANNLVLIGYQLTKSSIRTNSVSVIILSKHTQFIKACIIIISLYYLATAIPMAIKNILGGRQLTDALGSTSLLGSIVNGIGIIVPTIIGYYIIKIKRNYLLGFGLIIPYLIIQILFATRFKILFTFIPFFIVCGFIPIYKLKFKKILYLGIIGISFILMTNFLKENRDNIGFQAKETETNENLPFMLKLANNLSNEGIIKLGSYADRYFEKNDLKYGTQSTFILYFWIPRNWWKSKPTALDYWMIREFDNVSDAFSSASGFMGELRADFGWFSLIFSLLMGIILKKLNNYVFSVYTNPIFSYNRIFAACLYPYVFFFIRSPLTSSISLIFEMLIYWLIIFMFGKRITNNKSFFKLLNNVK